MGETSKVLSPFNQKTWQMLKTCGYHVLVFNDIMFLAISYMYIRQSNLIKLENFSSHSIHVSIARKKQYYLLRVQKLSKIKLYVYVDNNQQICNNEYQKQLFADS